MAPKGGIDYHSIKNGGLPPTVEYGESKWGNIALAKALHVRYPDISSVALHPGRFPTPTCLTTGMVATNLTSHFSATAVVLDHLPWLIVSDMPR